ncbi:MAG TPA: UDP-N-acetylmuramyl peptide synthase [Ruminococcaceae bacterium]|nr:UDP-N-acetylmuramyl peptide synthase [Oscillospiraceae bacterium]
MIIAAVSALFALVRQNQMLQQNSYFPSRYFAWVKDGYSVPLCIECIAYCAFSLLFGRKLYTAGLVLISAVLVMRIFFAVRAQKKSIKKLVLTARVKRLFAAAALILLICILVYALFPNTLTGEIFSMLAFALAFVSPLLCLLCRFVTAPLDKAITKWYINDAKRILKEHKDLIVIGITGSYGKTSTKFILNRILSERYNVAATPHSFNTPMGVVRTVREYLKPQTQIFICEMGAKNIGDIKEICDIVHPKYGIITSVGEQHLDTFKTVDNVFKTKFELATEVLDNGGEMFVNGDSKELISRIDKTLYSVYGTDSFDFRATDISYGKNGSEFTLNLGGNEVRLSTRLLGLHNILNIAGAAALSYKLGVTPENIRFAVSSLKPTEHRLEIKQSVAGSTLIDDAYNANPEGSIEALHVLSRFDNMKKVVITPGLIELGSREHDCNFALGLEAAKICDIIIFVGINRSVPLKEGAMSQNFPEDKLFVAASFKEAMAIYGGFADKNTVVLLENDLPDNYLN